MVKAANNTLEKTAKKLASSHRKNDEDMEAIYLAPDENNKEIRLVEVSKSVGNTGDILPFGFKARPDLGMPFPMVIVLVAPEEWDDLKKGNLELPESWNVTMEQLKEI